MTLFIPRIYALSISLIIPGILLGYNFLVSSIKRTSIINSFYKLLDFLGRHTLEIYLAQAFTTQYYLKFSYETNIIVAWGITTIILTVFISYLLYYSHLFFYTIICHMF